MREGTAHQVDRIEIFSPVDRHHRRNVRALSLSGPRLDHVWAAHFTIFQRSDHITSQYSQVPSRWVVSVSGTRKYGAVRSFWLLVHSSAEHHFVDVAITTK